MVKRHVASEITLLCDKHHREKTSGLLPLTQVREADRNPYNKQTGVSPPYNLHYSGNACELVVGSNDFTRRGLAAGMQLIAVAIDRTPLLAFTFDQGHLFLTLQVFDDDARKVLWIEQNELRYCITPWDIHLEGRNLVVRERKSNFLVDVVFNPPNRVEIQKGRFSFNGLELLVRPSQLCYANNFQSFSGVSIIGFDAALVVGEPFKAGMTCAIHLPPVNRGQPNREAAAQWMQEVARFMGGS